MTSDGGAMSGSPTSAAEVGKGNCSKLELEKVIEGMEKDLEELQTSHRENINSIRKLIHELDELSQSYNEEFGKLFRNAEEEVKKMSNDVGRAMESLRNFLEDHKKREENLDGRILVLKKVLNEGELELKQRRRRLNLMKLVKDSRDMKTLAKINDLDDQREFLEALNQTLVVKERESHDELEEARKALIDGLSDLPNNSDIGVKTIGELDFTVFLREVKKKHGCNDEEAYVMAFEVFSTWEGYLADPDWHPLKVVNVDGQDKEIIDEDDEKLKGLKDEYGEDVCKAVTRALTEIMEYNPIQRRTITDLWNYKQNRIATLGEGFEHLLKLWDDDELTEEV